MRLSSSSFLSSVLSPPWSAHSGSFVVTLTQQLERSTWQRTEDRMILLNHQQGPDAHSPTSWKETNVTNNMWAWKWLKPKPLWFLNPPSYLCIITITRLQKMSGHFTSFLKEGKDPLETHFSKSMTWSTTTSQIFAWAWVEHSADKSSVSPIIMQ